MPNPILGIVGAAGLGAAGSAMQAGAAKSAASDAASAQVYSTDRQIEAAEKAQRKAVRASREGNELARIYTTKGAERSKRALSQAAAENQRNLLDANGDTADALISGAKGAREATVAANLKNNDLFKEAFEDSSGQLKDWRVAGRHAIAAVSKGLEDGSFTMDNWKFKADPGYQFRLKEGEQALNRSAAAGGNLLSGDQLAALTEYGQDFASNEYGAAYTREAADRQRQYDQLLGVADRGQKAVNDTAALRSEMVAGVGQGNLNIGEARAGFSSARGAAYADAATRRGNILGSTALTRGNILADMHKTIADAKTQEQLNVANTIAGSAANTASTAASAYQSQGNMLGQIYSNRGQQQQAAIGAGVGAVDSGISNWMTYNMLNKSGLLGGAG